MSEAVAFPQGAHLAGVRRIDGVAEVEWSHTEAVRVTMKECALDRGLVTVTGPVGVGKTFSVARGAEACDGVVDEVVWLELSSSMRGRALLAALYPDLCGGPAPKGDHEPQLAAGLRRNLADTHRLVIVDEAQHIGLQAMHAIRGLHSDPHADFGLVLVGTPPLQDKMPPEIRSRRTGSVALDRMSSDEAPEVLAVYHPLFAEADPGVLAEVNRRFARGEFRWWAKILVRVNRYASGEELTMEVFERLAGGL